MFLSNLHGLAGGSLIFTEQTEFTKLRICEFAYLQTVNEENIRLDVKANTKARSMVGD